MSGGEITADYLIKGGGVVVGVAFADSVLTETDATLATEHVHRDLSNIAGAQANLDRRLSVGS